MVCNALKCSHKLCLYLCIHQQIELIKLNMWTVLNTCLSLCVSSYWFMTLYTRDHVTVNTVNPVDVKRVTVQSFSCLSLNLSRATFPVKAISPPSSISCPAVFPLRRSALVEPGPGALWQEHERAPGPCSTQPRSRPGQNLEPQAPQPTEPRANKLMVASCSQVYRATINTLGLLWCSDGQVTQGV